MEGIALWLTQQFNAVEDFISHEIKSVNATITIFYLDHICENEQITKEVITPFLSLGGTDRYEHYLRSLSITANPTSKSAVLEVVLRGEVVVLLANDTIYSVNVHKIKSRGIEGPKVEASIQGPQDALSEELTVNLNVLRNRYPRSSLYVENVQVGSLHKDITLAYDLEHVNHVALIEVKSQLQSLQIDLVLSAGELQKKLIGKKRILFPLAVITERPDRVVKSLYEGKVIIFVKNSPFVLIVPSVFFDFFSSMDEVHHLPMTAIFMQALRYIGLFLGTLLPAFYVAVTSFNPELLRVRLSLSIAGSRVPVPYPAIIEVLLMLVMMEMLTEASIRLPKRVGGTATTVGGLILGQAASDAGLVSNIMIIIVATVAISNFIVPINEMGFAIRVIKYLFLMIAALFGLIGISVSMIAFVFYLTSLRSFGTPYLRLFERDLQTKKEQSKVKQS